MTEAAASQTEHWHALPTTVSFTTYNPQYKQSTSSYTRTYMNTLLFAGKDKLWPTVGPRCRASKRSKNVDIHNTSTMKENMGSSIPPWRGQQREPTKSRLKPARIDLLTQVGLPSKGEVR